MEVTYLLLLVVYYLFRKWDECVVCQVANLITTLVSVKKEEFKNFPFHVIKKGAKTGFVLYTEKISNPVNILTYVSNIFLKMR